VDAAMIADAQRYVMISSVGAENPPDGDDAFSVYLRAKAQADAALQASDLGWTIVRPGRLTDGPATGRVALSSEPFRGEIAREDVAAVLDALLREPRSVGLILYLNSGEDTIEQALAGIVAKRGGSDG